MDLIGLVRRYGGAIAMFVASVGWMTQDDANALFGHITTLAASGVAVADIGYSTLKKIGWL